MAQPVFSASAPPRGLDGGDVDLFHRHHRVEDTLCLTATSRGRVGQRARGDLPGEAPAVLAPAELAFAWRGRASRRRRRAPVPGDAPRGVRAPSIGHAMCVNDQGVKDRFRKILAGAATRSPSARWGRSSHMRMSPAWLVCCLQRFFTMTHLVQNARRRGRPDEWFGVAVRAPALRLLVDTEDQGPLR